jgi:hypothetical protein
MILPQQYIVAYTDVHVNTYWWLIGDCRGIDAKSDEVDLTCIFSLKISK